MLHSAELNFVIEIFSEAKFNNISGHGSVDKECCLMKKKKRDSKISCHGLFKIHCYAE
jgi:hypothetical protein